MDNTTLLMRSASEALETLVNATESIAKRKLTEVEFLGIFQGFMETYDEGFANGIGKEKIHPGKFYEAVGEAFSEKYFSHSK